MIKEEQEYTPMDYLETHMDYLKKQENVTKDDPEYIPKDYLETHNEKQERLK